MFVKEIEVYNSYTKTLIENCDGEKRSVKDINETTKKEDAVRRCVKEGFECEKIAIEKMKHFVSKEAFNIDGFGKKIVENF